MNDELLKKIYLELRVLNYQFYNRFGTVNDISKFYSAAQRDFYKELEDED